jgi:hypothetical protein
MIHEFKNLNEEEANVVIMAPSLVALLIAGAEGDVDQKEIDWGTKITHFRATENSILQNYYQEVYKNFNDTLNQLEEAMPKDVEERSKKINQELVKLNDILPKLDKDFAIELYKSLLTFSKQVAQASGGLWGYGSISPEEKKHLNLEVINSPENKDE